MTSRLDRLFILLESGSSAVTRTAAAKQIGEVQKLYPHELHTLLNRLIGYLHSPSWETRIAAAQSVEAILCNVPEWRPELMCNVLGGATATAALKTEVKKEDETPHLEQEENSCQSSSSGMTSVSGSGSGTLPLSGNGGATTTTTTTTTAHLLTFAEFQLEQILHKGARLIGSAGNEFDLHEDATNGSAATTEERLSRQRALLNEKLGITQASKLGFNLTDMITDDDVMMSVRPSDVHTGDAEKMPVEHILRMKVQANGKQATAATPLLSSREMNRAKRKARQSAATAGVAGSSSTTTAVSTMPTTAITTTAATGASSGAGNGSNGNRAHQQLSSSSSNNGHGSHRPSGGSGRGGGGGTAAASSSGGGTNGSDEPEKKKAKNGSDQQRPEIFYSLNAPVPDATGAWVDAINWPLESFCGRLYVDLFNAKWEWRHGAATALRALIGNHAMGAGKGAHMSREEMQRQHSFWLEDAALRLLCVLCLDRFGDFVSDQVVAPVRETCAQVLGAVVREMQAPQVAQIVQLLLQLIKQGEWEVRHGGLLGLKYVFVVREDLLPIYLPHCISDILLGLFDAVDDVGAVAAATLIPIAAWLPRLLNADQVSSIVKMLWDLLLDQDELTSACNSFMGLLAAILCLPNAAQWIQMESMATLVPRLWPFLAHSTSSVRRSTLLTLQTLTGRRDDQTTGDQKELKEGQESSKTTSTTTISNTPPAADNTAAAANASALMMNFDSKSLSLNFGVGDWQWRLLQEALRHTYQRILVEPQPDIQQMAVRVWNNLIEHADLGALLHAACPYVSSWICLAMQPPRLAFDPNAWLYATAHTTTTATAGTAQMAAATGGAQQQGQGVVESAVTPPRRRTQRLGEETASTTTTSTPSTPTTATPAAAAAATPNIQTAKLFLGGSEATPMEVRERNYMRARVLAARALGALSRYLVQAAPGVQYTADTESPIDCYTKVLLGHLHSRSAVQRIVCGLIIAFWAGGDEASRPGPARLQAKLHDCVCEYVYYDEFAVSFTRLLQEAHDFLATLRQYKVPLPGAADFGGGQILTLDQIAVLASTASEVGLRQAQAMGGLKPRLFETLEERRRGLVATHQHTSAEHDAYSIAAQSALAGAIVCLRCLPTKLNPVVRPLMESIKREECQLLQELSAQLLVQLMELVGERVPSPNGKILNNLATLLRSDPEFTPKITCGLLPLRQTPPPESAGAECVYYGILSLNGNIGAGGGVAGGAASAGGMGRPRQESAGGGRAANQQSGGGGCHSRGPGRPTLSETAPQQAAATATGGEATAVGGGGAGAAAAAETASNEAELKACRVQRIGAAHAITSICRTFGERLLERVPVFEQLLFGRIEAFVAAHHHQQQQQQQPDQAVTKGRSSLEDSTIDLLETNELVTSLQLVEVAAPHLPNAASARQLSDRLFSLLPHFGALIQHPLRAVRHMVARCIAALADVNASRTMDFVVGQLVELLRRIDSVVRRQGAVEAIERVVERLQIRIVPYIVLLVVPLLGRMSDPDEAVRLLATHCFATLVQLMPLDARSSSTPTTNGGGGSLKKKPAANAKSASTTAAPAGGPAEDDSQPSLALQARKTRDREFLDYLFAPQTIPDYCVPVPLTVELRSYQQAGVNWLWFLNKYNLHGILCDDMGLGKTLQAICILAGDHQWRRATANMKIEKMDEEENGENGGEGALRLTTAMKEMQAECSEELQLPSLVVCPPTLTGHWVYEVEKFLGSGDDDKDKDDDRALRPLHYVGLPVGRERLRGRIVSAPGADGPDVCNLVVASYDTVRKDIDFFASLHWNYCILDEGHIIKNGKTKSSRAIKQLRANHRLILSGTPIQNNVLELWSLFDFLMPGFLGTERQFVARYSRPILAARDSKSSAREQEAGVLAMEALHRQVLPFLLRRVKEDVLTDLPPKITQDLLCELSGLQERLYEDFSRTHLGADLKQCLGATPTNAAGATAGGGGGGTDDRNPKTHIFHALRYLQNVCNHPKLVLTPKHPEYARITQELATQNSSLNDIEHSAKLPALKQLLLDCGIGVQTDTVSQHRALIFCQLKAMLDIVERDLLRRHLPAVSYLRLDGSVPASMRQDIVNNFNNDPSIDVLLLTTQVGGLGLNLTGADTVIFVEHDWNPMKDLQAMDRAHRIGQRKVVNVYRLITRKSLEEKIMGLQKFKLLTANTVVSADNAALGTMATGQLFDLFQLNEGSGGGGGTANGNRSGAAAWSTSSSTLAGISGGPAGGGSHHLTMNAVIENLPDLWSEHQYDEEYDLSNFVQSLRK